MTPRRSSRGGVQGTVRRFDPSSHCGEVLLDDGAVLAFDAAAFDAAGLRLLRFGQRVRLRLDSAGSVDLVTLVTFDDPARS